MSQSEFRLQVLATIIYEHVSAQVNNSSSKAHQLHIWASQTLLLWVFSTSLSHQTLETVSERRAKCCFLMPSMSLQVHVCGGQLRPGWHQSCDAKSTWHNCWSDQLLTRTEPLTCSLCSRSLISARSTTHTREGIRTWTMCAKNPCSKLCCQLYVSVSMLVPK